MSNEKKTILVTGGAGYIGVELCKQLLSDGYKVKVLDLFLYGDSVFNKLIPNRDLELIHGDVRNVSILNKTLGGVFGVIHLAAIVGAPESSRVPDLTWSINLDGTKKIYEGCLKNKVTKLIFASTVSNYGAVGSDIFCDEESELDPISPYAESKVQAEQFLLDKAREQSDLDVTVMRFATVFGVAPRMRFDLLLNEFVRDAYFKKSIDVFGNQGRTFVHVKDVARAVLLVLSENPEKTHGQIYNIGDDRFSNMTKFQLGKLVADTLENVSFNPVEKILDNRNYKVSFKKALEKLGFACETFPVDGVREIVKYFEDNKGEDFYSTKFTNLEKYLDIKE